MNFSCVLSGNPKYPLPTESPAIVKSPIALIGRICPALSSKYNFVLASLSPQEITAKKIEDIKKECKEASRLVTTQIGTDPEDVESYYYIPGSIGVTRFLQEFGVEGEDSSIVVPFNETK